MQRFITRNTLAAAMTVVVIVGAAFGAGVFTCIALIAWLTWVFRSSLSFPAALVAAMLLPVVGIALITTWSYSQPIPFQFLQLAYFIALIWASALLVKDSSDSPHAAHVANVWAFGAAFIPALLVFVALAIGGIVFGLNLGWMLTGDAQNNTVAVRELVLHNGADPEFNSAPALTQLIMASAVASSVTGAGSAASFIGMIQSQALVLTLMWCAVSVMFGLIAVREFSRHRLAVRMVAVFGAAVVPFTWFVLGFSIAAGFYNTPATLLALTFAWIVWREQELLTQDKQWRVIALMLLITLLTAMAWVPLALIPGIFLIGAITRVVRIDRTPRQLFHWQVIASAAVLLLYVATIIAPSFFAHSDSLAADGWMAELSKVFVFVTAVLALIVAGLLGAATPQHGGSTRNGLFLFLLGMTGGLGFLMFTAARTGAIWSYYPRKFAWMAVFVLMFLAVVVALSSVALQGVKPLAWQSIVIAGSLVLFGVGLKSTPFMQTGPLKVLPLVDVAVNGTVSDAAVEAVAEVVGERSIRLEYDENDFLVNQWVFQWASAHNGSDSIWSFAYSQIKTPEDVCAAAASFGGEVTLLTRSQDIESAVMQNCGDLISGVRGRE